jgi:hypothetical protein
VSDFDRHRQSGACLDPVALGLVERAGLWASPERHERRARDGARLRQNRRFPGLVACVDATEPPGVPDGLLEINISDLAHGGEAA